jgi:putative FmdB family regulatory protein
MPLYEYDCLKCGRRFEVLLLRGPQPIVCSACGHDGVERVLSAFAVSSKESRQANVESARKRNLSLDRDKVRTQIEGPHDH